MDLSNNKFSLLSLYSMNPKMTFFLAKLDKKRIKARVLAQNKINDIRAEQDRRTKVMKLKLNLIV